MLPEHQYCACIVQEFEASGIDIVEKLFTAFLDFCFAAGPPFLALVDGLLKRNDNRGQWSIKSLMKRLTLYMP